MKNISFLRSMYLVSYILSYFIANTSALETKISELTHKTGKYKQDNILKNKKFKVKVSDLKDFIRDKKDTSNRMSDTLGFSRCMHSIIDFTLLLGVNSLALYQLNVLRPPTFIIHIFSIMIKKDFHLKSKHENLPQM